ncbi:hypothetical protein ILUMI_03131 [Ignelater luminosus]|uniref:Transposase domain-containing protein n=1 Tax=Ignelater luminosus TaxID=2038154 RepID=A0A8K0DBJ0_IGNLU|nr:hypothetical protein ILUMI_03131 [Ignelater luminosus]
MLYNQNDNESETSDFSNSFIKESENDNFKKNLCKWAVSNNITHIAVNSLLKLLHHSCLKNLPLDARTLLGTPRHVNNKQVVAPGYYVHLGFKNGLEYLYTINDVLFFDILELYVDVDSLPLSKNSGSQFYPILCSLTKYPNNVAMIGIYHGYKKPSSANEFIKHFVEEITSLIQSGFSFKGITLPIMVNAFICDAPAKSFISYCKGHTGFYSCTKCTQKGKYIKGRTCFPKINSVKRTNRSFIIKQQPQHHTGTSLLEKVPKLGMVTNFPLEYMHLVCLGVVKKLLMLWYYGTPAQKLSKEGITATCSSHKKMANEVPSDFVRKPRSIEEIKRWKATEFRMFLLYTGPVVMHQILSNEKYLNFLALSISIRILASKQIHTVYLDYANSLLIYFAQSFGQLYGEEYISHNVHGLLHMTDDVQIHGQLDSYSAFPFENFMQSLKKQIRKSDNPLAQIVRRISERKKVKCNTSGRYDEKTFKFLFPHKSGPIPIEKDFDLQYMQMEYKGYILNTKVGDNCCKLVQGEIIVVYNFGKKDGVDYIIGRVLLHS